MTDPITFSTPLMAKVFSGLSGLIGGVSFMAFYRPKNVWDAAVRSGLSVTTAIVFSPIIMDYLQFDQSMNHTLATSMVLGFCSWSVLSLLARFLINIQDERVNLKLPEFLEKK